MKDVTVQDCSECRDRFCKDHITWHEEAGWICDKCLRRKYGYKRGPALPRAVEATA